MTANFTPKFFDKIKAGEFTLEVSILQAGGLSNAEYSADGQQYTIDLAAMLQVATCTKESHAIRCAS